MTKFFCEGAWVPSVYLRWAFFGAPSYLSSCKIWTKLDNPRPGCSDLTYWTWPQSAIFRFRGKHIWTTPYVARPHCLRTPTFVKISWSATMICPKTEFEKTPLNGGILLPALRFTRAVLRVLLCVTVQNFSQIGQSATKVEQFNLLDATDIRQIGFSKKASLGYSARCGLPLSTYTPHFVKMAWSSAEKNAPKIKFENSTFGFNVNAFSRSGTSVCVIMQNFS